MAGIIGINAYHADASAAFVGDGKLIAAAEEERFNRIKHSAGFPAAALRYVVEASGAQARSSSNCACGAARSAGRASCTQGVARATDACQRGQPPEGADDLREYRRDGRGGAGIGCDRAIGSRCIASNIIWRIWRVRFLFRPSTRPRCSRSTDSPADFASTKMWKAWAGGISIQSLGAVAFPHSLGLAYTALTQYLGFPNYGDEYKVMGLASFGEPEFLDLMRELIISPKRAPKSEFRLSREFFNHHRKGVETAWESGEPMRRAACIRIKRPDASG